MSSKTTQFGLVKCKVLFQDNYGGSRSDLDKDRNPFGIIWIINYKSLGKGRMCPTESEELREVYRNLRNFGKLCVS